MTATAQRTHQDRIQRSFLDISEELGDVVEQPSILFQMAWDGAIGWSELLQSSRVLIVSEAGSGKTHECRAECEALWDAGEAAFLIELAELSSNDLDDLLGVEERKRFDAWLVSQSDVATFFLDSVDELKLTLGSFKSALTRLSRALHGQLGRARVVITTRPIPVDRALVQRLLPVPPKDEGPANELAFANIAINGSHNKQENGESPPEWRYVALLPLSDDQIREMATLQEVSDAEAMFRDIRRRNAEDFARRPQDLIELCTDWRDFHRIRTHREQVGHNIAIKLRPRTDRREKAQLTEVQALEGASRLALAALLTRKLTIRHSAAADRDGVAGTALDPAAILRDWTQEERETLLERALFGFSSYGRVRFHHRSVIEYLAAERLEGLLENGMSIKALKRLLFAETASGIKVVKPSMRPVAAWLAYHRPNVFSEIRDREPEVLLVHADPESLTVDLRINALRSYVRLYGQGGWRGKNVPRLQIHRLATTEIGMEVVRLWHSAIENSEVNDLLMEIIAAAPTKPGADVAYSVLMESDAGVGQRIDAFDALLSLNDERLEAVTVFMEDDPERWPSRLISNLIPRLLPEHITAERLCRILGRYKQPPKSVDMLNHLWIRRIASVDVAPIYLDALREGLTELVVSGATWSRGWPHLMSPRPHLLPALAAVCLRQMKDGRVSDDVVRSSTLTLRLAREVYRNSVEKTFGELRQALRDAAPSARRAAFWADDAYCQSLHPQEDHWHRFFEVIEHGPIEMTRMQDEDWVLKDLLDSSRTSADRAFLLAVLIGQLWSGLEDLREKILSLRDLVVDQPELVAMVDERLRPVAGDRKLARMVAAREKRREKERRSEAKHLADRILFWRAVANAPETAFRADRSEETVLGLWRAMGQTGEDGCWNRRFLERYFSKDVADRTRSVMRDVWRNERPTLRSERAAGEEHTYLEHWLLGLSAVAAEAEDPNWALRLSRAEAELAARYATFGDIEFPAWLESLVAAHPAAVESVLGPELTRDLEAIAASNEHGFILQSVSHATASIAELFLPRIRAWIDRLRDGIPKGEDNKLMVDSLREAVKILLERGGDEAREHVEAVASQNLSRGVDTALAQAWLPILMQLNPDAGVAVLDRSLEVIEPSVSGKGAEWICLLFGGRHLRAMVDLGAPGFTPSVLPRLVRIAYRHVAPSDDIRHEGVHSPGLRDHAQDGRNALLSALLDAKGPEGWKAKLEMANDPLLSHFRDRALAIACEKAAEETEVIAFSESQVVVFDRDREAVPATHEEMFALLVDRLDDIDDLLLHDESPRAAWALIDEERIMRREISRELRRSSNGVYSVDQEAVTVDEKETDIRLRVPATSREAVIELKLGDKRPGRDLRDTIRNQLVTKYMASDACRSGCLLVTIKRDRVDGWVHPDTGKALDISGLEAMLKLEAEKVTAEMGGMLRVTARVLDLRPRLSTEKATAANM